MLDTNALSAFVDGDSALGPLVAARPRLSLPVIVLGEYLFGVCFSRRHKAYEAWLTQHLPDFQVLLVDEHTAAIYAEVRAELKTAGTPIPENDLWIRPSRASTDWKSPAATRTSIRCAGCAGLSGRRCCRGETPEQIYGKEQRAFNRRSTMTRAWRKRSED